MILTCPECKSRYVVNPSALLPRGRTVRCAKCAHSWFEDKPEDDVEIVPPEPAEPENNSKEDSDENTVNKTEERKNTPEHSDEVSEFPINQPKKRRRPVPKGSNLPALQNQQYGSNKMGWISLVIFVTAIISSFLIFQGTIVSIWPASNKLYTAIGLNDTSGTGEPRAPVQRPISELLVVGGLAPSLEQVNNVPNLFIKGYIENISDETQTIPSLIATLKDASGQDIRSWNFVATSNAVNAGDRANFETSLPNPPSQARDISVTIVDNR